MMFKAAAVMIGFLTAGASFAADQIEYRVTVTQQTANGKFLLGNYAVVTYVGEPTFVSNVSGDDNLVANTPDHRKRTGLQLAIRPLGLLPDRTIKTEVGVQYIGFNTHMFMGEPIEQATMETVSDSGVKSTSTIENGRSYAMKNDKELVVAKSDDGIEVVIRSTLIHTQ